MIMFPHDGDNKEYLIELNEVVHALISTFEVNALDGNTDDWADWFFFPRIVKENRELCRLIISEVIEWTKDEWKHYLGYLHEYALLNMIESGIEIYSDNRDTDLSLDFTADPEDPVERWIEKGGELEDLSSICFYDHDFTDAERRFRMLHESGYLQDYELEDGDLYFLPRDVRESYLKDRKRYGFWRIARLLPSILEDLLTKTGVEKLFWNADGSLWREVDMHTLIEGLIDPFCALHDLDISRESKIGSGSIDFKISRGSEKLLIEFKKYTGSYSTVRRALFHQLPGYLSGHGFEFGYLVLLCFEKPDEKVAKLVDATEVAHLRHMMTGGIMVFTIELQKNRVAPSKLR